MGTRMGIFLHPGGVGQPARFPAFIDRLRISADDPLLPGEAVR